MRIVGDKNGWLFYLPARIKIPLVILCAISFMILACTAMVRTGHSISDEQPEIVAYGSPATFWWKWVADKTFE